MANQGEFGKNLFWSPKNSEGKSSGNIKTYIKNITK